MHICIQFIVSRIKCCVLSLSILCKWKFMWFTCCCGLLVFSNTKHNTCFWVISRLCVASPRPSKTCGGNFYFFYFYNKTYTIEKYNDVIKLKYLLIYARARALFYMVNVDESLQLYLIKKPAAATATRARWMWDRENRADESRYIWMWQTLARRAN